MILLLHVCLRFRISLFFHCTSLHTVSSVHYLHKGGLRPTVHAAEDVRPPAAGRSIFSFCNRFQPQGATVATAAIVQERVCWKFARKGEQAGAGRQWVEIATLLKKALQDQARIPLVSEHREFGRPQLVLLEVDGKTLRQSRTLLHACL